MRYLKIFGNYELLNKDNFLIEAAMLCVLFYLGIWLQIKKEPARRIYSYLYA